MNIEIEKLESGIQCDNINCDWVDYTVTMEQLPSYLGVPCPKCGENLLTENDLKLAQDFIKAVDQINLMPEEEINELAKLIPPDQMKILEENFDDIKVEVTFHKQIKFKPID